MIRAESAARLVNTHEYQRRLSEAKANIREMLRLCKNPYIACSFGKDSEAMLQLVMEERQGLDVLLLSSWESRKMHSELDNIIKWFKSRWDFNFKEVYVDRVSGKDNEDKDWEESRHSDGNDFLRKEFLDGYDGVFMGLRMQESRTRRINLLKSRTNKGLFIHKYLNDERKGMYRCCPLAEWSALNVATCIGDAEIPVLGFYKRWGMEGRTTMRLTGAAARMSMTEIKINNPGAWNQLIKRFPELKAL